MDALEPANASDLQKLVKERLDALEEGVLGETVTIEWRDGTKTLPVISMPVGLLYYNPETHRVRAQRTLDPHRDAFVIGDPYGEKAQAYLHELLLSDPREPDRDDPEFVALRDDLNENGQAEPGVITRSGILINGNSRRAALKELGKPDIRVAVLPPDAGVRDWNALELSLQLRKQFKRDYSFVNTLLAIDELATAGVPPATIQREFRIVANTYERSRWILQFILDVIKRSTVEVDGSRTATVRLIDFETHQGKLEELYRAYTSLKSRAPDDAEILKETRLIALARNRSKTDLRLIEPDFFKTYLEPRLPKDDVPAQAEAGKVVIPGTGISLEDDAKVGQVRAFADRVLADWSLKVSGDGDPATRLAAADRSARLDDALETSLELAGKSLRLKKRRLEPAERLSDANDDLEQCARAIVDARAANSFTAGDLEPGLETLRQRLRVIRQLVERDAEGSGVGIGWLHSAVGDE